MILNHERVRFPNLASESHVVLGRPWPYHGLTAIALVYEDLRLRHYHSELVSVAGSMGLEFIVISTVA